jgi:HEAT repeat protein
MPQGSKRKWLGRIGLVLILILVATGCWAWKNATFLKARYTAYQLHSATSDEQRAVAADRLLGFGPTGLTQIVEFIQTGDKPSRDAVVGAIERKLNAMPEDDPGAIPIASLVLDAFSHSDDSGKQAILGLISLFLKHTGNTYASKCREAIVAGLKMSDQETRMLSVRLAVHPDVMMRKELIQLLGDPDPRIRGAALFGVATATEGESAIADEEIFRWLHDPDSGVRKVCYEALVSRGRSDADIALARRFSHPDPSERLKLLYDLRYEDDVVDPEPWLEQLSRDQEPAIRAGAARVVLEVVAERKLSCPAWVTRVADTDTDPTVRRIAGYFRRESIRATGNVRPVNGP